jgi:uncharacterized protein (TIRG00374 family)
MAVLAWVFYTTDVERTLNAITQLSPVAVGLVIGISIIGVFARVSTWYVLVVFFTEVDWKQLVTANLVIKFVNSLFPSRLSGRSIAPFALRHFTGIGWNEAMAVTVAHTGLYAVLYGIVTLFGLAINLPTFGPGLTALILLSVAGYIVVGGGVILAGWRLDLFNQLVSALARLCEYLPWGAAVAAPIDKFRTKLLDGSEKQFQQITRDHRSVFLFIMTWVIALLIIPTLRIWVLLSATGVTGLNPLLLPLYVVVAYSVTILPLTPGGIGVAEATAVAVFVALGVPEAAIVSVVFLDRVFGVYLPSLLGWVPLVRTDFTEAIN